MRAKPNIKSITCGLFNYRLFFTLLLFIGGNTFASGSEALYDDYTQSETATVEFSSGTGTQDDPYLIKTTEDFTNFVTDVNNGTSASACYKLGSDIDVSVSDAIETPFTGTFDGDTHTISGLSHPLFNTINGGIVKNVFLDNVDISGGINGNVGAICGEAKGDTRIYNCGILATNSTVEKNKDGYDVITDCSSSVSGTNYVGGIVGLLDGTSRVINCFSYADVSGGSYAGGIVGYNNQKTTSAKNNQKTMVFACMFYGDIKGGSTISPIYGGNIINNKDANGVSNFNYFRLEAPYVQPTGITYNCALGAEDRFLQRFEFYRHLLNSHRELAGWWATGTYSSSEMLKWVMEPQQIGTATPYPILKKPGRYHSVVNIDVLDLENNSSNTIGTTMETLKVKINMGSGAVYGPPIGAVITAQEITLNITNKDPDHFNFNYYKVQLPYYNDVGTNNYRKASDGYSRVVTGWKIVDIKGGTPGSFTTGDDAPAYNFADRNCTNKDLYSVSKRVFNQGAYWDVPEGVTGITIEPYWARCAYLADPNADKVYNTVMGTEYNVPNVGGGQIFRNTSNYNIAGESQIVYTLSNNARDNLGLDASHTVYDHAIVLVGNFHKHNGVTSGDANQPYTIMSIDADHDNEPDYSYILRFDGRMQTHPVRVDFLNIPGLGMAQKSTGGTGSYNFGIMQPIGWFESTNTSLFRVTQFEYDRTNRVAAPYIVQGGVMEQWVSGQNNNVANKTSYFLVGGNVWFKEFHRGTHQDNTYQSKHPPVSVTGGDYDEFYLTGLYTANVTSYADNAECYINGGRFGTVAGAAMEGIGKANGADNTGNITWQVQNADIREFYAGGINAAKPVTGNLSTTITGGHIVLFCGGPKFGDMSEGKTVTTTATGCTFGTFFGAGYGGNSYSRQAPRNHNNVINFPHNDSQAGNDYSWNDWLSRFYTQSYNATYGGVSTQFNYQFLPMSNNTQNVARIFVEYVKFSLATTRNVTSTLTDCTITNNFYGGGSLGKVDGPVTSTLDGCIVNGNVFGAGFSASLPTVEVDDVSGFEVEPFYYTDLGTYRVGVKKPTTTYTWQHGNSNSIDKTNHILYTTEDLTTLGTVTGKATLNITGNTNVEGIVFNEDGTVKEISGGAFGGGDASAALGDTEVNINGGTSSSILNVYGGGNRADVGGNVTVNMLSGNVNQNVYGGGALANTNINNVTAGYGTDSENIPSTSTNTTTVNLLGGTIRGDAYGGGLGRINIPAITGEKYSQEEIDAAQEGDPAYGKTTDEWKVQPVAGVEGVEALVYGDVYVNLGNSSSATAFIISHYSGDHTDVVKSGRVFGCNNLNGSPKGTVLVKVLKTTPVNSTEHTIGAYEVQAVYGGGNLAAYDPIDPFADGQFTEYTYSDVTASHDNTDKPVQVVIDGCDETSIEYVYGGGNAAPTPATDVTIIGSFEIGNVFGGGNGKDKYTLDGGATWKDNDGADVGLKGSTEYGTGKALASVYGGTVHSIFGGSNTKGDIRISAEIAIDKASDCSLNVTEAYGGGNEAYLEGNAKIVLGCIDFLQEIYGGAKNADVGGDIELTITSGHFDRVFGGNNLGGTIEGSITVNIEETGCNPITIGELYGCGNAAAYSTPDGKPDPTINIKSFTSIGRVFGGGLGEGAVVTGNPTMNINEVVGANASMTSSYAGSTRTLSDNTTVTLPVHAEGEIGAIGTVFGGGNAAAVNGNTNVYVGTEPTITYVSKTTEPIPVVGVDIRGNVYGGGNAADVTGSTNVVIGQ